MLGSFSLLLAWMVKDLWEGAWAGADVPLVEL